ncbi:hypothetical protein ME1_00026 [Bartonella vinsonii subsp. arupensis OK-94-513]|uniref:Uncharacterized protein n=2 Tax=Bartonella vinsonii subsp. arupensis TaxID=110578 RepID=J0QXM7_BARVI|nr:hypothetical protein [Bartonella vinsonii]EJF90826.1 hypothetical protein ME1_00026 [Bartonella vinsonii subsp. arupensis OK-94-513]EJF97582.1 hypothetical protein MEI_01276 [Bartonella vinsonii subsp. arupensis Pm136co]
MKSVFYFLLGLFLFLNVDKQSVASELETIQKAELSRLVVDVNHAVRNGNFAPLSAYMPDRLYKEMARRLNKTEDSLRHSFLEQLHAQFENLPSGAYHLDEKNIDYLQTNKGTFYALIPTILEMSDRVIQYKTLAIFDKTQWYLIYGGQKTIQNPVFLEIYPDFNRVLLPKEIIVKK